MTKPTTTKTSEPDELKVKLARKRKHIQLVQKYFGEIVDRARAKVRNHDHDKIEHLEAGHLEKDMSHYTNESHHWWATKPSAMTVMDLMEAISDMLAVAVVRDGACEIPLGGDLYRDKDFKKMIVNTIHEIDPSIKVKFFDAKTYKF